jgi:hypothetical protein
MVDQIAGELFSNVCTEPVQYAPSRNVRVEKPPLIVCPKNGIRVVVWNLASAFSWLCRDSIALLSDMYWLRRLGNVKWWL